LLRQPPALGLEAAVQLQLNSVAAALLLLLLLFLQDKRSAGMIVLPWQQQLMPCSRCWPSKPRHKQRRTVDNRVQE
jgi:hypothetical protein